MAIQVNVPPYIAPSVTREELEYADLPVIDLESTKDQVEKLRDALIKHGFFYVVGHGLAPAEKERIFSIADVAFTGVSDEEKRLYEGSMEKTGSFQGYKLRQYWHIDNGVQDQVEIYNLNRDITKRQHPEALRPYLPEIEAFGKHNHFNVLHPILQLFARGLGLPENALVDIHNYSAVGETYVRFMKYYPRSAEDEEKAKNVWLKGHTDFGTMTILYSQPVSALQILTRDGQWKWVRHVDNALVINAGDMLEFFSGGLYHATIHRVVQPPKDQRQYTRLGVFYFCKPDDTTKLLPLVDNPINPRFDELNAPTVEEWRKQRTASYGRTALKKAEEENGVEEEIISGVVVKHYS
ncbi:hypothetical protein IW261DRAFT_1397135 [Armillaria novae-zelandiae]|uniref:Fe2OG dioxygenase domain-containing protein n=1 Tax=Armillaria novae-zelandiae TaxID=153914 RepID=A0AA39PBR8_9AGAR|nr:hypothetical protein IW261DRAFT_1397135 [Armillaria novae-zelandiae]